MALISREEALEIMWNLADGDYTDSDSANKDIKKQYERMLNLPIIESRPKGKWENDISGRICTNCRHEFDRELEYICGVDDKCNYVMPNFCPWCGADMREIEEEEEEE